MTNLNKNFYLAARMIDDGLVKKMGGIVKLVDWIEENKSSFKK